MSSSSIRSHSWMPLSDVTPMYRKIPNKAAIGIIFRIGSIKMDRPWRKQASRECKHMFFRDKVTELIRLDDQMALTNQQSHYNATDPLLYDFLNHRFWSFAHHCERVGMSDWSDCGSTEPRHTKYCTEPSHANQNQQVKVEARSFDHFPLRFTHNQTVENLKKVGENFFLSLCVVFGIEVLTLWSETPKISGWRRAWLGHSRQTWPTQGRSDVLQRGLWANLFWLGWIPSDLWGPLISAEWNKRRKNDDSNFYNIGWPYSNNPKREPPPTSLLEILQKYLKIFKDDKVAS